MVRLFFVTKMASKVLKDLSWGLGLDEEVLDPVKRVTELRNFLEMRVKPQASLRGRA